MKGVFLDCETLNQNDLDFSILTSTLDHWDLWATTLPEQTVARIAEASLVVTNKVRLTADILQQAPKLRCICICATGTDNVDLQSAKTHGISVYNVKGYSTASVIQHTIGLLIMMASRLGDYSNLVHQGAWINAKQFCLQAFKTTELANKTLGIVGYGAIGSGVANVARQLGMQVMVAKRDRASDKYELEDFLPHIDILSLHCPLTAQTKLLIGAKELSLMKKGSLLINVSRGGLVDEKALSEALFAAHLAGAALDVVSQEPPSKESILFSNPPPHLIITPHVAWATKEARQRLLNEVRENVLKFTRDAN
ncbi:MAG: D-2-hydroxyacid dehydrogenase [Proteobacteria bacterium]|nr:D-2-hydroxyacid dehydrogenase [Pseudomonadota bacterium]